ncbi:lipopolysaccharide export system protein LptA [Candidatus Phycosocius bacilliformis]|uniref:Lipopolysaccharide export system protein LptA n=1 Tax=Candidatus Phycosocius bacilliformis TaxID=1445552 RepID=A0A2P2EDY4_9PROT|nr:LptA/OstA family protein [Candidatus Phycosocius bacilliformis]GBF59266.1 lipopolysaccharide export system protein LptA [Candidatus Phycosocius bacilliformis]
MTQLKTLVAPGLLLLLGLGLAGGTAWAQANSGNGPVEVAADDLVYDPEAGVSILVGNASVAQDGAVLRAPRIRVTYLRGTGATNGDIDKVYTEGETFYVTATEKIRGDRAVYDAPANTVQFFGNVVAVQGKSVLKGSQLTLNTKTRASTMRGMDGRVRAVIFPNQGQGSNSGSAKK